jgi:phospholipase/lecithinase/hemolysin
MRHLTGTSTPLHHNFTISYENQVRQWYDYGRSVLEPNYSTALVASWIGINDINDSAKYSFPYGNATDFASLYREMISSEFDALESVYEDGYRSFLFMNLPTLDRTPGNQLVADPLPSTEMIGLFNSQLNESAKAFSASHDGAVAMVFDVYGFLSQVMDNPADFDIKNTTSYCPAYAAWDIDTNYASYGCLPIYDYFWYNTGHITYHVHELLAGALEKFLIGHGSRQKPLHGKHWGTHWIGGYSS